MTTSQESVEPDELEQAEIGTSLGIIGVIQKVIVYAMNNLPSLIIDGKTGEIRWQEAYDLLLVRCENGAREPTQTDMLDVIEELVDKYPVSKIDELLKHLPWHLRLGFGGGLVAGRTALNMKPDTKRELEEKGETLILQVMATTNNASVREAHDVLVQRPKLMRFLTKFLFEKLNLNMANLSNADKPVETSSIQTPLA